MIENARGKVDNYFSKKYPELANDYIVVIKPNNKVDLNDNAGVKNIVTAIYMTFLSKEEDTTSRLYILVRRFANLVRDPERIKVLEEIYFDKKTKFSVPTLEIILKKYMAIPTYKVNKKVANGNKRYSIGELNEMLNTRKMKIFELFGSMYDENDIKVIFSIPNFSNVSSELSEMEG